MVSSCRRIVVVVNQFAVISEFDPENFGIGLISRILGLRSYLELILIPRYPDSDEFLSVIAGSQEYI